MAGGGNPLLRRSAEQTADQPGDATHEAAD
jgi:hypothetical protein